MLETVKTALRLKSDAYNDEINMLIEAAKADMRAAGIKIPDTMKGNIQISDPQVREAIILYCKANFGYGDTAQADKFKAAYDARKLTLSYTGAV